MNRDDIIRLAEEAGVHEGGAANWVNGNRWEQFAFLVAAAEREECAKVLDEMAAADKLSNYYQVAALAIRERSAP
jgi:hypothetical protein